MHFECNWQIFSSPIFHVIYSCTEYPVPHRFRTYTNKDGGREIVRTCSREVSLLTLHSAWLSLVAGWCLSWRHNIGWQCCDSAFHKVTVGSLCTHSLQMGLAETCHAVHSMLRQLTSTEYTPPPPPNPPSPLLRCPHIAMHCGDCQEINISSHTKVSPFALR